MKMRENIRKKENAGSKSRDPVGERGGSLNDSEGDLWVAMQQSLLMDQCKREEMERTNKEKK